MPRFLLVLFLLSIILSDISEAKDKKSKKKKGSVAKPTVRKCQRGEFVYKEEEHCLQRLGPMRHPQPCRDLTHIQGCKSFKCPPLYHKCPNSYCIEYHRLCDKFMDCPYGEDENKTWCAEFHEKKERCELHVDQGQEVRGYRCKGEQKCVPRHQVCDNFRHCKDGGDEAFCVHCPKGCKCNALTYKCSLSNLEEIPANISHQARYIDLSRNNLTKLEETLDWPYCGHLTFKDNFINTIAAHVFEKMENMFKLSLAYNEIEILPAELFSRTKNLQVLCLTGNSRLRSIESDTFQLAGEFGGLQLATEDSNQKLTTLSLRGLKIEMLDEGVFNGLGALLSLDLSDNNISFIHPDAFVEMGTLQSLNISHNPLLDTEGDVFGNLTGLRTIIGDHHAFCCSLDDSQPTDCFTPQDVFSSCKKLVADETIGIFLWVYAIVGILGHIIMSTNEFHTRKNTDQVGMLLRYNTSLCSYVLSVYCLVICVKHTLNVGTYINSEWRRSFMCHILGGMFRAAYVEIHITIVFSWVLARFVPQPKQFWKGSAPGLFIIIFIILSWAGCIGLSLPPKFISLEREDALQSSVCITLPTARIEMDQYADLVSYFGISVLLQFINVITWIKYRWSNVNPGYQNLHDKTNNEVVEISTRPVEALVFGLVALPAYLSSENSISGGIMPYVVLLGLPLPGQLRPLMAIWRAVFVKKHKKQPPGQTSSIDKSQTLMSDAETIVAKAELTTGLLQDCKLGGFKVQGHFRKLQHVIDDDNTIISYREIVHICTKVAKALDFMDNNGFRCMDFSAEDIYLKDTGIEAAFGKFRFEEVKLCLSKVQKSLDGGFRDKNAGKQAVQCLGEIIQILIGRC